MKRFLADSLRNLIEETVRTAGVELFDVEFNGRTLQVFIDAEGGVTLGTCARVSELLSARLDDASLPAERYFLEVSSPGLERKLRGIEDFRRQQGEFVHVVARERDFYGVIAETGDDSVTLNLTDEKGEPLAVPAEPVRLGLAEIRRARRKLRERELFARRASARTGTEEK